MTSSIAGTMRYAELKPDLPASMFPPTLVSQVPDQPRKLNPHDDVLTQYLKGNSGHNANNVPNNEFSEDGLDDQDFLNAGKFS